MSRSFFHKQIIHVFEIFHMTSLIRCQSNRICIFLNSGIDHLFYTTIMTKVDHLNTRSLDNSSHYIYSCIVTVKKSGCSNNSYFILRNVGRLWIHFENMIIILLQFTIFFTDCLTFILYVDKKVIIMFFNPRKSGNSLPFLLKKKKSFQHPFIFNRAH